MIRNLLILPDGTELFSGVTGQPAIRQATLTRDVNDGTELMPGAVCAAVLEATVFVPETLTLAAGQEVTLCHVADEDTRTQVGIFLLQSVERRSRHLYRLTACDRVGKLDADLTGWLNGLTGWPYTLQSFAGMVCAACGLTLSTASVPNGTYPVPKFTAGSVTGRQLMGFIAQAAGCFCRAGADGTLELAWYTAAPVALQKDGENFYYSGGLQYADYTVAPVQKVQLRQTAQDVGTLYPDDAAATNTLILTGNPLLTGAAEAVAQSLYALFAPITYTPGTVTVPAECPVLPGHIVTVHTPEGERTMYIMSREQTGQRAVLRCTGSPTREQSRLSNESRYQAAVGKTLQLQMDVDGLRVQSELLQDELLQTRASIAVQTDGIVQSVLRSYVRDQELEAVREALQSQLEQLADSVSLRFSQSVSQLQATNDALQEQLNTITKHITFHMDGMTIGASDSPYQINIDNDQYQMTYNGREIFFVRSGEVYTPALTVGNALLLLGYQAARDADGNVNWDCMEGSA